MPMASACLDRGLSSEPYSSVSPGSMSLSRNFLPSVTRKGLESFADCLRIFLSFMAALYCRGGAPRAQGVSDGGEAGTAPGLSQARLIDLVRTATPLAGRLASAGGLTCAVAIAVTVTVAVRDRQRRLHLELALEAGAALLPAF